MTYTVYANRPNRYAAIHRSSCFRLRQHGGESRVDPPTGRYSHGLETLEAAWDYAVLTGYLVRGCTYCRTRAEVEGLRGRG